MIWLWGAKEEVSKQRGNNLLVFTIFLLQCTFFFVKLQGIVMNILINQSAKTLLSYKQIWPQN